jgi:hypothetical protein
MPDDCPVDDESRRALRDLARRAEWRGRAGASGAAQDARTLRELGREIQNALPAGESDRDTWGHRAGEALAAYCQRAQPDWSPEQIAELTRLRDDALTALAPGPAGEAEAEAAATASAAAAARSAAPGTRPTPRSVLTNITSSRPAVIALAVAACIVLVAAVLLIPHFVGNNGNSAQTTSASTTNTAPAPATTDSGSGTSTTTASTSASASPAAPTTSSASSSQVTKIQFTPDVIDGSSPEVIVTGTITAAGTGDVTVDITVTGSSGQPQVTEIDDSGQTSYNLTQTVPLSQWCGQSSVKLTVSSGAVSQSTPIAISGCS